jgi:hypothetical protein
MDTGELTFTGNATTLPQSVASLVSCVALGDSLSLARQ